MKKFLVENIDLVLSIDDIKYSLNIDDKFLDSFFREDKKVPDTYRYTLKKEKYFYNISSPNKKISKYCKFHDQHIHMEKGEKTLVFLLESPHNDEYLYENNDLFPICPANGLTGQRIESAFSNVLYNAKYYSDLPPLDNTKVILCNPIQWQTSLHFFYIDRSISIKSELRDHVWNLLWENDSIKNNFINRLKNYNPVLIINACTGNNNKKSLKFSVNKCLNENFKDIVKFSTYHPSHFLWSINPYGISEINI